MSWLTAVGSGIVGTAKAGKYMMEHSKQVALILDSCSTVIDKLSGMLGKNSVRDDIAEIKSGVSELSSHYESELNALKEQNEALENENQALKDANADLVNVKEALEMENKILESGNKAYLAAIDNLNKELQASKTENENIKKQARKNLLLVSIFGGIGIIAAIVLAILL